MKRRGFTLIELLATIVVLAIIALIAIPIVFGVIDKAKQASFEDSVKISSRQIEMYLFQNNLSEIPADGVKVKNLNIKSDFISGTFKEENGKIVADKIRNKEYCASGPINKLVIRKDCDELDTTPAVLDESKLVLSSTSNSIIVNILDGFAVEEESYIKSYEIIIKDGKTKIESKKIDDVGKVTFEGLTSDKEYNVEVIATNSNDLPASIIKTVRTSSIEEPTYSVSPSGWAQSKTVTITYPSGYTNEYSLDGGTTWKKYTSPVILTDLGSTSATIIARVNDGKNYVTGSSLTVTQIYLTTAENVSFTPDDSNWNVTNVYEALEYLRNN